MICTKIDWHKGQPDDAGAVHREGDIFGFVKILGDLSRLEGVHSTHNDEEDVVEERHDGGYLTGPASEYQRVLLVEYQHSIGLFETQPCERPCNLKYSQAQGGINTFYIMLLK